MVSVNVQIIGTLCERGIEPSCFISYDSIMETHCWPALHCLTSPTTCLSGNVIAYWVTDPGFDFLWYFISFFTPAFELPLFNNNNVFLAVVTVPRCSGPYVIDMFLQCHRPISLFVCLIFFVRSVDPISFLHAHSDRDLAWLHVLPMS